LSNWPLPNLAFASHGNTQTSQCYCFRQPNVLIDYWSCPRFLDVWSSYGCTWSCLAVGQVRLWMIESRTLLPGATVSKFIPLNSIPFSSSTPPTFPSPFSVYVLHSIFIFCLSLFYSVCLATHIESSNFFYYVVNTYIFYFVSRRAHL